MIVYKVVRDDGLALRYHSAGTGHGGILDYQIGVETLKPHDSGPLCTFGTVAKARSFMRDNGLSCEEFAILKCRGKKSEYSAIWYGPRRFQICALPKGTVLCDVVLPLGEVIQ